MKENQINIIKVNDDSFVGLRLENKCLIIYIPNLYNIGIKTSPTKLDELDNKDEVKKSIFEFLKTLSLATNDDEQGTEDTEFTKKSSSAFASMRWLIMDFVKNGFYEEFGKKSVKGCSGKINWKKTMKQVPRVLNDDIFFDTLIVDKKIKVSKIISEVYKYCLQLSIDCIGWVWNMNAKVCEYNTVIPSHLGFYISVLKRELVTAFLDSKKEILLHLQNILNGVDTNSKEAFSYGVKSYHTVFEKMIDKMFGNVPDISEFYPRATWHMVSGGERQTSKLRPDTIMKVDNAYIIDAKYYDNKDNSYTNLPSSSDIQKQITYGSYLDKKKKKMNIANIRNVFILPCDQEDSYIKSLYGTQPLFHFGYATANWSDTKNLADYETVFGFYIDLKYLINNYDKKNDDIKNKLQCKVEDEFLKFQQNN